LAVAGVYLYFKINETEPQLPADVADWTLPDQVDIRAPLVTTAPSVAPAYETPTSPDPAQEPSTPAGMKPATAAAAQKDPPSTLLADLPPLPKIPATAEAQATPAETSKEPAGTIPAPSHSLAATAPATASAVTTPASASPSQAPSPRTSSTPSAPPQASLFGATRLAVQGALDRGELSQALLLLSDWYDDPSLAPKESQEVDALLGQLAGSVIYSTEHRLEPPYLVQAGERLEDIAKKYGVPWQLLAKINGIDRPGQLQPGQKLKVLRGPFSALIDLGERRLTVLLARRYAGKFAIDIDPQVTVEEGSWKVDQKLVTPGNLSLASSAPGTALGGQASGGKAHGGPTAEEESLILTNTASKEAQIAVLKGPGAAAPGVATEPKNRVIRLKTADLRDVFNILSVGSNVIIRR